MYVNMSNCIVCDNFFIPNKQFKLTCSPKCNSTSIYVNCIECNKRFIKGIVSNKTKCRVCVKNKNKWSWMRTDRCYIDCSFCKKNIDKTLSIKNYCQDCYYGDASKNYIACSSCKKYVKEISLIRNHCQKCYYEEADRRLHNSIISVAYLYLRNEDWLNENVSNICILCNNAFIKKRRSREDKCNNCNSIIEGLRDGSIDPKLVYHNVHVKITFRYTYNISTAIRFGEDVRRYPLLKTIKQEDIKHNFIINIGKLCHYKYLLNKEIKALIEVAISKAGVKKNIELV